MTLSVHYLLTYCVNRLAGQRVLGSAPAFRDCTGSVEEAPVSGHEAAR
jgi:hypothetical protein